MAKHITMVSTSDEYNIRTIEKSTSTFGGISRTSEKNIMQLVTKRWVQEFMTHSNIVMRAQCGKLQISPVAQEKLKREIVFFLDVVAIDVSSVALSEGEVENTDETHFIFDADNVKTRGFCVDSEVRYTDVTSGGEEMIMMVGLSGGKPTTIDPPFMIFEKEDCNYRIRRVTNDITGACYRTGPKSWTNKRVMVQWLEQRRASAPLPDGKNRFSS